MPRWPTRHMFEPLRLAKRLASPGGPQPPPTKSWRTPVAWGAQGAVLFLGCSHLRILSYLHAIGTRKRSVPRWLLRASRSHVLLRHADAVGAGAAWASASQPGRPLIIRNGYERRV